MTDHELPQREDFHHLLRQDFSAFISQAFHEVNPGTPFHHNWHIDLMADYLEAVRQSQITRLIINIPPRSLKSLCVSVAWPAFLLGHEPSTRILVASYSQYLAIKHSQDTRRVANSEWFLKIFPEFAIQPGHNEKHKFVTTQNGFRFATSTGGSATGEGGDFLIIDDPLNPLQAASKRSRSLTNDWFDQTFSTRLNDKKNGRIIVVMQRLHADDLSGHLLARGGWEHLCLPASSDDGQEFSLLGHRYMRPAGSILHETREGRIELDRVRRDLGSAGFMAQYQQMPLAEGGHMIERQWLKRYTVAPARDSLRCVQSWDTAIKSAATHDASACLTFGEDANGLIYLLDALTLRAEYPALRRAVLHHAEAWSPQGILIEDKASGQSLLQDLRQSTALPVIACLPRQDKITRMAAVSPLIESGSLIVPQDAPWLGSFEAEICAFPHGAHDDQADALSQYLGWRRWGNSSPRMRHL